MNSRAALELRGITRRFGGIPALDGVDFTLQAGEIHALLGENGAGKSTLMNIVGGLLAPDTGQMTVDGVPRTFATPDDAARAGIGMVHQHFLLVPSFTVAENLALVAQDQGFFRNPKRIARQAQETMARLGWRIPLNTRIADLPVGTQQRVEILKALLGNARILLFDEPTAVLAPSEIAELFGVLRSLRAEGRSVVFVTHKLKEVMALCDRVTVLRRGRLAGSVDVQDTDPQDLAQRMVGEEFAAVIDQAPDEAAVVKTDTEKILVVEALSTIPQPDAIALREITFSLGAGEILGFAGVDGNGQAELAQVLTGLRPWHRGSIILKGKRLPHLRPQEMARHRIALIPPDRHKEGLALPLTVAENLMMEAAGLARFRRGPFLDRQGLRRFVQNLARDFDIRASNLEMPAAALSGGNQQKIVIARALWRRPSLLVAVSPTRGLDVAAAAYVQERLRERQQGGGGIILISTELDEVLALSSRIAVLYEGRIAAIVPPETPRETLGLLMGGKRMADV